MSTPIIAARHAFPIIELAPLAVSPARTVEELIAGLSHNNPELTASALPPVRGQASGSALFLVQPVHPREHVPMETVLPRLEEAGFTPAAFPELASLKGHADELWAAGVFYVATLGPDALLQKPDGGYGVYLITNPEDRGFHLHWLGGDWGGETWFLVRRCEPQTGAKEQAC